MHASLGRQSTTHDRSPGIAERSEHECTNGDHENSGVPGLRVLSPEEHGVTEHDEWSGDTHVKCALTGLPR